MLENGSCLDLTLFQRYRILTRTQMENGLVGRSGNTGLHHNLHVLKLIAWRITVIPLLILCRLMLTHTIADGLRGGGYSQWLYKQNNRLLNSIYAYEYGLQ